MTRRQATSRQVRDHPQRVTLRGDTLTVRLGVGMRQAAAYTLSRTAYETAGTGRDGHTPGIMRPLTPDDCPGNPRWARRGVVRAHAWPLLTGDGGDEQAERLVDAQQAAIEAVLRQEEMP